MANIKDVSTVVASALAEVGISGTLDVHMEGGEVVETLASPTGDDVEVIVIVKPIEVAAAPSTGH